jgi:hypothetical protein
MMEINIHSKEQEFHRFSTDDFALIEIGLGSYTISSLTNFLNGMSPDFGAFFTGASSAALINKLIGEDYKDTMKINDFNLTEKKYELITGLSKQSDEPSIVSLDPIKFPANNFIAPRPGSVSFLLNKWNEIQRGTFSGTPQQLNGYKAVAYKIQNSSSGCITFNATFNILGSSRTSLIRLHLLESSDAESSRSISFKGSPIFTAPPQTAYGATWGYRNTTSSDPGAYFSPSQGGADNPENTVSAPMDMAFDPSVGKWQSGTQQMLMRLLDNVDPASIPNLTPEELEVATRQQVYDDGDESPFRIKFSGPYRAIPLSSENGNPHLFGPDYKDGCAGNKQAIVQVVNRMSLGYKAGSVVVCSKMLGDSGLWTIVGGVGREGEETGKMSFGNFEYQQHIIPASLYFTDPISGIPVLPDAVASKCRLDYYLRLLNITDSAIMGGAGSSKAIFEDTIWLNLAASDLTESDPKIVFEQLKSIYGADGTNIRNKIIQLERDCKIGTTRALDFINNYFCTEYSDSYETIIPPNEQLKIYALPKNIKKHSARTVTGLQVGNISRDNFVSAGQVPVFWGMLFPDGYKSETVKRFQDLVTNLDIYKNDANLSELTCGATECIYDFKDQLKNLRFARFLTVDTPNANFFIRKTGGLYRPLINLKNVVNNPVKLLDYVNMIGGAKFSAERMKYIPPGGAIYGAEPINPGRIQFSSLSIESMYFASEINEQISFEHLYKTLTANNGFLNRSGTFSDNTASATYRDYAKFLFYRGSQSANITGTTTIDKLNKYNINALELNTAYGLNNPQRSSAIFRRHSPPIGSLFGLGLSIAPDVDGRNRGRTPAMPVLTCKSTIKTSAQSLSFTCDQSIGVVQKRTVSGGQGPTVTIFPIGGGIGWSTPGNPSQTWDFVQWGGGNDIDSFGTTSLHVRVFEHVPPNQLIYIGPLFTPLHFNPSEPLNKFVLTFDANNNPIVSETNEPNPLTTDFKVPTRANGSIYPVNDTVTAASLGSFDSWKNNTIRRGKMTTKGGFAYLKPVIVISSATLTDGGSGYKQNEKLTLSDGSEILIKTVRTVGNKTGVINNDYEFKSNIDGNFVKTSTNGYRSIQNISATGGSGTGAKFTFGFVIKYDIGYDLEPKESTPSKGLLVSSNNARGEQGHITTQSSASVELVSSNNNRTYDIFYFYHNDPSHYSLQDTLAYSNGSAQYIISEVKAQ